MCYRENMETQYDMVAWCQRKLRKQQSESLGSNSHPFQTKIESNKKTPSRCNLTVTLTLSKCLECYSQLWWIGRTKKRRWKEDILQNQTIPFILISLSFSLQWKGEQSFGLAILALVLYFRCH